jgi:chromosome partitioning protein
MPVIAVINRKGGSGKSTLATHLAAWCAHAGLRVMLGDVDRQQSSQHWLALRRAQPGVRRDDIVGWTVDPRNVLRPPAGVTHVVLDTPGGLGGFELARVVMAADAVLMPVCNSVFDRTSAAQCHAELQALPRVASGRCAVAAVGMRLDARTRAGEVLHGWAADLKLPFVGVLRETQLYVRCIEQGLTLFDLPAPQTQADRAQWRSILQWLGPLLQPVAEATPADALRARATPAQSSSAHVTAAGARAVPREAAEAPDTVGARSSVSAPALPAAAALAPAERAPTAPPSAPAARPPNGSRSAPSAIGARVGRLLESLPIPRFLQKVP